MSLHIDRASLVSCFGTRSPLTPKPHLLCPSSNPLMNSGWASIGTSPSPDLDLVALQPHDIAISKPPRGFAATSRPHDLTSRFQDLAALRPQDLAISSRSRGITSLAFFNTFVQFKPVHFLFPEHSNPLRAVCSLFSRISNPFRAVCSLFLKYVSPF